MHEAQARRWFYARPIGDGEKTASASMGTIEAIDTHLVTDGR